MNNIIAVLFLLPQILLNGYLAMPQSIRIIYNYEPHKRQPELDAVQSHHHYQQFSRNTDENSGHYFEELQRALKDSTLTATEKMDEIESRAREYVIDECAEIIIYDLPRIKRLTDRLDNLKFYHEAEVHHVDVHYLVLLDYINHTDTLCLMASDSSTVGYKGKYYQSSGVFNTVQNMIITNHYYLWKAENIDMITR